MGFCYKSEEREGELGHSESCNEGEGKGDLHVFCVYVCQRLSVFMISLH